MSPFADLAASDPEKENVIDPKPYQRLIGSLMYIAQTTRPKVTIWVDASYGGEEAAAR